MPYGNVLKRRKAENHPRTWRQGRKLRGSPRQRHRLWYWTEAEQYPKLETRHASVPQLWRDWAPEESVSWTVLASERQRDIQYFHVAADFTSATTTEPTVLIKFRSTVTCLLWTFATSMSQLVIPSGNPTKWERRHFTAAQITRTGSTATKVRSEMLPVWPNRTLSQKLFG